MKGIKETAGKLIAGAALKVTKSHVDSYSGLFFFQPKMPKGFEKLRKS